MIMLIQTEQGESAMLVYGTSDIANIIFERTHGHWKPCNETIRRFIHSNRLKSEGKIGNRFIISHENLEPFLKKFMLAYFGREDF